MSHALIITCPSTPSQCWFPKQVGKLTWIYQHLLENFLQSYKDVLNVSPKVWFAGKVKPHNGRERSGDPVLSSCSTSLPCVLPAWAWWQRLIAVAVPCIASLKLAWVLRLFHHWCNRYSVLNTQFCFLFFFFYFFWLNVDRFIFRSYFLLVPSFWQPPYLIPQRPSTKPNRKKMNKTGGTRKAVEGYIIVYNLTRLIFLVLCLPRSLSTT